MTAFRTPSRDAPARVATLVLTLSLSFAVGEAAAQGVPPTHDAAPRVVSAAEVVAEFPRGTFLENLALDARGALLVTSYLEGKVYRLDDAGRPSVWTSVDGTVAGIAMDVDGTALLSGWLHGKEAAVFAVDAEGRSRLLVRLQGGQFPNGIVRLAPHRFLVADSYLGAIWEVDAAAGTARQWLTHELLSRARPNDRTPGVNGLKLRGGVLWASNTSRRLLLNVPVVDGRAGTPEVARRDIGLDDFDLGDDGTLYGATHVDDSLVALSPDGRVSVLAGEPQGMAGSTAVLVQRTPAGMRLVVSTNGGMSKPPAGGVQPGRVVRVVPPAR